MSSYRALVIDFGGVLTSPLDDAMQAFADDHGIEKEDLMGAALSAYKGETDVLVTDFETGRMSEDEFAVQFAHRLSEYSGVTIGHAGIIERLFETLELEEDMFELVRRARAGGRKTALLSNSWGMKLYPRDRLDELFDVIVISGEVGLRKPDPEIFALTVEKLDLEPGECVFVDDHPGHLSAAREAGMTTVLHREPAQSIQEVEALLGL